MVGPRRRGSEDPRYGDACRAGLSSPAALQSDPALQQPFEAEGADPLVEGRALGFEDRAAADTFQLVWSSACRIRSRSAESRTSCSPVAARGAWPT
jgi:hypothetical protein